MQVQLTRLLSTLWRASLPLKKNMFEVAQVIAGRMSRAWYRAHELGKTWYPSLKELVEARKEVSEYMEEAIEEDEVAVEG